MITIDYERAFNSVLNNGYFEDNENDRKLIERFLTLVDFTDRMTIKNFHNGYFELLPLFGYGLVFNANCEYMESLENFKYIFDYIPQRGIYGGGVFVTICNIDHDFIIEMLDIVERLKDYAILDDEIYSRMEDELVNDTTEYLLTFSDYEQFKDKPHIIKDWLSVNGYEIDCSWDFDERELQDYLKGVAV